MTGRRTSEVILLTKSLDFVADESHCFSGQKFQTCWTMSPCIISFRPAGTRTRAIPYGYGFDLVHVPTTSLSPLHGFPFASLSTSWSVSYTWTMAWWGHLGEEELFDPQWLADWHIHTTIYTFFWYVLSYHTAFLFLVVAVGQVVIDWQNVACLLLSLNSTICFH